jgi:hypothetical protein
MDTVQSLRNSLIASDIFERKPIHVEFLVIENQFVPQRPFEHE